MILAGRFVRLCQPLAEQNSQLNTLVDPVPANSGSQHAFTEAVPLFVREFNFGFFDRKKIFFRTRGN
jgi:hypothetical protein